MPRSVFSGPVFIRPYHLFFLRKEGESGPCGKDRILGTPTNRTRTDKHRPGKESASQVMEVKIPKSK